MLPLGHHCFAAPVPSRSDYPNKDLWQCARDLWNQFVTVGQKVDGATNRVDYIIAAHVLDHLISQYARNWSGVTCPVSFPLCHPDLTMSNIFVDDQYNITCIIDWAFVTTVPLPLLLLPPGFPQSRHRLDERVCLGFRDGFQDAAGPNLHNIIAGISVPKAIQRHFTFSYNVGISVPIGPQTRVIFLFTKSSTILSKDVRKDQRRGLDGISDQKIRERSFHQIPDLRAVFSSSFDNDFRLGIQL